MRKEHDEAGNYIPCKQVSEMSLEELREEATVIRKLLGGHVGEQRIFSLPYLVQELLDDRDHYARR